MERALVTRALWYWRSLSCFAISGTDVRLRCCTLLRRLDNLLLYSPTPYRLPATVPSYAVSTTCYCTLLRHPTVPRLLRQTADAVQRQQRSQTAARLALPELDEIDFGEADGMEVRKARATMGSVYFQGRFFFCFLGWGGKTVCACLPPSSGTKAQGGPNQLPEACFSVQIVTGARCFVFDFWVGGVSRGAVDCRAQGCTRTGSALVPSEPLDTTI
eukprot:847239-Rhodomonas_salina.4